MSREHVETCRQALDAVVRRDRASFLALCDPDLEDIPPRGWPESRTTRGREAVWDLYVENSSVWEQAEYQYIGLIEAGDDKTVGEVRAEVRGKESGAGVTWSFWQVATFQDGKFVRIAWFPGRAEALESAGQSE